MGFLEVISTTVFPDFPVFPDREIVKISRFPTGNWNTGKCASLVSTLCSCTEWKFQDFSGTQILREINLEPEKVSNFPQNSLANRVAHFPVFQFPVGKREIWPISRSGKTGKSGKMVIPKTYRNSLLFPLFL